jgi:glycosyltransferase involved in cell wall biosynthesis
MRLLVFSEFGKGGIADYAHEQGEALSDLGIEVDLVCPPGYVDGRVAKYRVHPILRELHGSDAPRSRLLRRARLASGILHNWRVFRRHATQTRAENVLTHFSEYLAPLWAPPLRSLRRQGTKFYSVLHDPERTYAVGPRWWHERSVRSAFDVLDGVFVHTTEPVQVPDCVQVVAVPYGTHAFPPPERGRREVRLELDIPEDALVLIAFGYIRNNKNLDLVLQAIRHLDVYLIVAGTEQEGDNKGVAFYRDLAEQRGCSERCRWVNRFLSGTEVADLFCASDISVLTYSRSFNSWSSALSVTTNYRVPCIVSSGSDTMRIQVEKYGLGIWVEPDSAEAIRAGLEQWPGIACRPAWEAYMAQIGRASCSERVLRNV